jgi:DNA-binding HxlR family transcriptional regulator
MTYTKNGKIYHCPVEAALDVIGGKWGYQADSLS